MAIDSDDDLLTVDAEFLAGRLDDADIGLVRNQPININGLHACTAHTSSAISANTRTANLKTA